MLLKIEIAENDDMPEQTVIMKVSSYSTRNGHQQWYFQEPCPISFRSDGLDKPENVVLYQFPGADARLYLQATDSRGFLVHLDIGELSVSVVDSIPFSQPPRFYCKDINGNEIEMGGC